MTKSRRDFLRESGFLFVSGSALSMTDVIALVGNTEQPTGPYPDVDFLKLDSWIVIRPDNTATFFVGKTDLGQGTGTAFRQIMSDELDIKFENTTCVMGSTDITVDQGGSGGSDALQTDGYPMRRVAAEARRVLLEMAAEHFGVPATSLRVSDGVVSTNNGDTAEKEITYGELIGGRKFNVTLSGRNVDATTGKAPLKAVQAMKNVGRSPRRDDIPAKVDGTQRWAVDMKVPGMLHARNVRPPMVGATLKAIDASSVSNVPGVVKVVSRGNYVAVVCEREEHAIRAARQLKVEWTPPATAPFPASNDLFSYMRSTTPSSTGEPAVTGDVAAAISGAATVVEAKYDVPFQDLQPQDEAALNRLLQSQLPPTVDAAMSQAEAAIRAAMAEVSDAVAVVDATLGGAAKTTMGKMEHELKALQGKVIQAAKRRDDTLRRQFSRAQSQTFPHGHSQERTLGVVYFLNQYGPALIDRLLEELPVDMGQHWVLSI